GGRPSHNGSLIDLLGRLSMHLGRYPATTLAYPGRWETSNREHEQLVDAIEARNGELAADLAGQHFTAARDIRLKLWETDPA
ncbi:FCD domain-containing protein, partial [Jiangella alkaliphila]|uniref:FCD domain-containing protein n=1 Tax=Jiangella alkaliphila TaxID=419479 RepID=UPI00191C3D3D